MSKLKANLMKSHRTDDPRAVAAASIAEGGWSSIYGLVESLSDEFFEEHFYWIFEEEDTDE
jgi:hypothetical protein